MKKKFYERYFKNWLSSNAERFKYPPERIKRKRDYIEFRLRGINPMITVVLCHNDWSVCVTHRGNYWDSLCGTVVLPVETSKGNWIDKAVIPEFREVYPSRAAIFVDEFESLLKWVNKKFAEGQVLLLAEYTGGSRFAEIRSPEKASEMTQDNDCRWHVEIFNLFTNEPALLKK